MNVRIDQIRKALQNFDFKNLFVEELGWDNYSGELDVQVNDLPYRLSAIAHKRGMAVYLCPALPDHDMPDYPTRRKIERQVTKTSHEHFIIYTDADSTMQIWQWVKREPGKPSACREHTYYRGHTGEALAQRLAEIVFTLEEEEEITLVTVAGRAQAAFDVERVTKRFYDYFKEEHASFLKFLKGIPDEQMKRWYVSVMLNRLMFIYFIQKKGFLDDDLEYLRNKLAQSKHRSKDRFYREFLCPLFFEGFAKRPQNRSAETNQLLGKVPYLNGGLFLKHQIEELYGEKIQIPDSAFERVFDFFDRYRWHLDERPLRHDNEINPDVLGYIFEKYINQKQMGAYYTKEDITGYISRNTIIPFLFNAAEKECKVAFEPEQYIWKPLQVDPDRYIYPAVRHGITCDIRETPPTRLEQPVPLLPEIEAGITDVSKRGEWNKTAPLEVGLPTEIWREVVARRQRYFEIRGKLAAGEVHDINDLITLNLDIGQFAQDVIESCEGPELLRAFWHAITRVTVLDPTCGSGAFLFAALNILETLYEASLDRMQVFIDELERSGEKHRPEKFSDFRKILEQADKHPSRKYYIYKSIIINNLYGVDIMDEAVEIAKLRLFLKLVAQVDHVEDIEPLPDIDFNIRAGNTLVGFATYDQVRDAVTSKFDFEDNMKRIEEKASDVEHLSTLFRQQQTELGGTVTATDKQKLRRRLALLEDELNRYLANEYGIDPGQKDEYEKWLSSHKPFHWFIEFYSIMRRGGFDVVIGNPPYLELKQIDYQPRGFTSLTTHTVHALCIERGRQLLSRTGCMSMIVPLAIVSTQRMQMVQQLLENRHNVWYSNYSWRPGKLFSTVNRALTIFVVTPSLDGMTFSTNYQKWISANRSLLMPLIHYVEIPRSRAGFWAPKLGNNIERSILKKVTGVRTCVANFLGRSSYRIYYRTTGGLYWKVFTNFAPAFRVDGKPGHSSRETSFSVRKEQYVHAIISILSSDLFWWWYTITSNLRDLNPSDIQGFPISKEVLDDEEIVQLGSQYIANMKANSTTLVRHQRQTGTTETQCFKIQESKPIIDQIDCVLAKYYGFTEEELDFIINYDIKYRLGLHSGN